MRTLTTITLVLATLTLPPQAALPLWAQERMKKIATGYEVCKYIHPYFLKADFSGDKHDDIAVLVQSKAENKKGIVILFSGSNKQFILGASRNFDNGGDNFSWAVRWAIFDKRITHRTTFKEDGDVDGGEAVRLDRTAIEIREDEGSGGLIYFDGTGFVWIHQGD